MSSFDTNTHAFFSLVRAGLWEQDVQLASFGQVDFKKVYRLAEEQSVVGLVAAGIEHVKDVRVAKMSIWTANREPVYTKILKRRIFITKIIQLKV